MMACDVARGEGEVGVKGERGGAAGGRARLEGLVCGPIPRAPASWRVNWLWHGPGHLHHPGFTVARRQRPTRRRRPVTPTVEPTRSPAAAAGRCSQPWTWWVLGIGTGATGFKGAFRLVGRVDLAAASVLQSLQNDLRETKTMPEQGTRSGFGWSSRPVLPAPLTPCKPLHCSVNPPSADLRILIYSPRIKRRLHRQPLPIPLGAWGLRHPFLRSPRLGRRAVAHV